jgi:hypothetical protein
MRDLPEGRGARNAIVQSRDPDMAVRRQRKNDIGPGADTAIRNQNSAVTDPGLLAFSARKHIMSADL